MATIQSMCPQCGRLFDGVPHLLVEHLDDDGRACMGSGQCPRNPEADRRPLWSGKPNPHLPPAPPPREHVPDFQI